MNCSPMFFLIFILMKSKGFCITQKKTQKMAKMSVSTNKLSQNFAEHAYSTTNRACVRLSQRIPRQYSVYTDDKTAGEISKVSY